MVRYNALTGQVGLKVGPIVLETLVKHYFDRIRNEGKQVGDKPLKEEELLYDEAFNVIRAFLAEASLHTVEDVQSFSNTRTPSPPWVKSLRLLVPFSCCDEAAKYLIKALGGEDHARHIVGGTKWWQVRGINGVDAEWITAKKDYKEYKHKTKKPSPSRSTTREGSTSNIDGVANQQEEPAGYSEDMDEMRCILYAHGGGYYFGSLDQERYSIQRHARKIKGRVLAINYRLAPQYPFPCALQDLIAAYIFLIRPPPDALHRPVKPEHIVVAGDSAGGGLTLALLQVIRDSGLPMPAGGVLISPWCDLSHSFPSIHKNTNTDIIPEWGLSMQKPSTLWPPPSEEMTTFVQSGLRSRIRETFGLMHPRGKDGTQEQGANVLTKHEAVMQENSNDNRHPVPEGFPIEVGPTTPLPTADGLDNQTLTLTTESGEVLTVRHQAHLYTINSLIQHPLVSSVMSYLGGLCPLLIIASDKEVLRDEIIYTAHKAAHPDRFPIKPETRDMYPSLNGIEDQYRDKPTKVHLQVYDDCCHVLPVLFSFTTPAKYCHRAIASFIKEVTGMAQILSASSEPLSPISPEFGDDGNQKRSISRFLRPSPNATSKVKSEDPNIQEDAKDGKKSLRRSLTQHARNLTRSKFLESPAQKKRAKTEDQMKGSDNKARVQGIPNIEPKSVDEASETLDSSPKEHRGEDIPATESSQKESVPIEGTMDDQITAVATHDEHNYAKEARSRSAPALPDANSGNNPVENGFAQETTANGPQPFTLMVTDSQGPVMEEPEAMSDLEEGDSSRSESVEKTSAAQVSPVPPNSVSSSSTPIPSPSSSLLNARYAGEPEVYSMDAWKQGMIRERISTQGVIRPLESEEKLDAFTVPPEVIGGISELVLRRFIKAQSFFDTKFASTSKAVEKSRQRNLERSRKDIIRNMTLLQSSLEKEDKTENGGTSEGSTLKQGLLASSGWTWAWALDGMENPPPSSIVSRRDTEEARRLAKFADQAVLQEQAVVSGNNLWSVVQNFLKDRNPGQSAKSKTTS